MVMRVGGLATGMDVESIVNRLMEAERMPLNRLKQEQTKLQWKQDAFREMNRALLELEQMMLDMKLSHTYQSKVVSSSNEAAVTATAHPSSSNGAYEIQVTQLATNAINVGGQLEADFDPTKTLKELGITLEINDENEEVIRFSTYDENGEKNHHEIKVNAEDTIESVLRKITDSDAPVRAFYEPSSNRVVLETTRTGKYSPEGVPEIEFYSTYNSESDSASDSSFFSRLKLNTGGEQGGTNAKFTYNNVLEIESKSNSYTLNGINLEFRNVTTESVRITVDTDIDHTVEAIKNFVNKYNEVVEKLHGSQQEQIYRDFPPLTDEQKAEMTEDQIKQWEEKAKSGILRRESVITNGLLDLRQTWYASVELDGAYQVMTQIGISTSERYMDGGKLEIDEEKLREALRENPEDVRNLFANPTKDDSRGIIYRLDEAVKGFRDRIEETAGRSTYTLDNYTLGRRMKDLNERIAQFEARMVRVENRYWNQFTQLEKAIQRMNDQASYLFSQFGNM